ncbi:PREDICTED: natural killer cell receptor 2B4 [Crocodylus porosus]|uniref:natural killer cell receptor 2B4 n=1 Tax=Crocodylus porosus TaxID=8502 RepID=UPI00093B95E0|nr:PREDICTED: natural killer cell receptor 2B4 [Crocodylus porosus]
MFPLCLLLPLTASVFSSEALGCREMEVAAVTEKTMLLVPENRLLDWEEINWRVRLSSGGQYRIGTLVKNNSHVDLNTASPLGRRIAFHPGNLSLQIELVNKSDSGVYSMDVTSASGSLDTTCFRVSVFDRVQQPNLTALSAHPDLGWCNVTLSCQVQDADRVTYSWSRGASWSPATGDQLLQGHQSQLQLEITAGSKDTFYHCNASNAASWGTATIDVKPLCIFPATGKCPLADESSCQPEEPPVTIYDEVDETRFSRNLDGNAQGSVIGSTVYSEVFAKGQVNLYKATSDLVLEWEGTSPSDSPGQWSHVKLHQLIYPYMSIGPALIGLVAVLPQKPKTQVPGEIGCTLYSTIQPLARPASVKKSRLNPALTSTIYMEVNETFGRPSCPLRSALLPPKRCLPIPNAGGLNAPQHYNF